MATRRRPVPKSDSAAGPLLQAKLNRPNLGADLLERPHLVQALIEHAGRPLALVVAEAGFGKTTLLASFARQLHRPVVWYSLMGSDADPVVFGRYLLEGFRRERPRFGAAFERALEEARPGGRQAEMLAGTLANELTTFKGPPILLVLEDLHEVSGSAQVMTFLDVLLRHLPERVRIAISSRTVPPLALDRMRARSEIFELNSSHLRFSRDELEHLCETALGRPPEAQETEALEQASSGWPTAVLLMLASLEREPDRALEDVLAELRGSDLDFNAYLSSEVLQRLDPPSRELLESTAALDRFDAELAQALSRQRGVRARLDALVRSGLLRSFGAGSSASFEWHDLLRACARREIEAREGESGWRALHARTGAALRARGETERALRHALDGGAADEAAELLRELAPQLLRHGRAAVLLRDLEDLPPSHLEHDPTLQVAGADARQVLGRWDEAEAAYERALGTSRAAGDRVNECRALLGLGKVLNLRGRYEQVLGMSERGLAMAEGLGIELRSRLLQMKASAHFYLGQFRAAIAILDQVRAMLPPSADLELVVPTVHNLAIAYASQGEYREASREFRAALAYVRGTSSPRAPLYLSNLAYLLLELGELSEARGAAEEGLEAAQRFSNRAQETTCHAAIAEILAQGGDLDGALAALKRAESLNAELRMELIAADLLAVRGRIFCARGQYRRAIEFVTLAIERLAERPDAPRLTQFRATLAWFELRAGRPHAARDLLLGLRPLADASENEDQRMRVHYWLAEALLALGEKRDVDAHLKMALRLARERDYRHFLRVQAREEPAALLHALERGIELDMCAAALVESGARIEPELLELVARAGVDIGEAALAVLSEVGGAVALAQLPELARARRTLRPAITTALGHVRERAQRGAAEPASGETRAVRIVSFGPPRLEIDGQPLPASAWRTQRAFHLLLYLALRPRGATRDELLERFWPGRQAAAGRRNFHPTLSYIRSVLPRGAAPPLLRDAETYRVNPAYSFSCDAWEFEAHLDAARRAGSPTEQLEYLERAVALVERPQLEGVYERWAEEAQGRSRDRTESLLLQLGELSLRAGDAERALRHFRRAGELDEYRESTRIAVMQCLVAVGNRRAALVEYERLKRQLKLELGVDPLPETEEAARRLLADPKRRRGHTDDADVILETVEPEELAALTQVGLKPRLAG